MSYSVMYSLSFNTRVVVLSSSLGPGTISLSSRSDPDSRPNPSVWLGICGHNKSPLLASSMTAAEDTRSVQALKRLLRQTLRITITDGRVFLGTFTGTDTQLNILLANTDEFRLTPLDNANLDGRYVGLVMIPRRLIVRIEVHGRNASENRMQVVFGDGLYA